MFIDKNLEFSDAQAVTASAISQNVYDLFTTDLGGGANITPNARLDIGTGTDHLYLVVNTVTAATDTGNDATLTITLESADDAGLTTNAQVHYSTGAIPFATFSPAGSKLLRLQLPVGDYRRYLGVRFTVAAGPLTAGTFDAFLTPNIDSSKPYKSAFTVQ